MESSENSFVYFEDFEPFEQPDVEKLPSFPTDGLPPILREMIIETAESLQVDTAMTATVGLSVCALCIQKKFKVAPKPDWIEPLNLFTCVVARPSERKSPCLDLMLKPIVRYETNENARRRPEIEETNTKIEILNGRIASLKKLASKPLQSKGKNKVDKVDFEQSIQDLQKQLSELEKNGTKPFRLLADDCTVESLISLMAQNRGKIAVISDEGGLFGILSGRYNNGMPNLDALLKAFTGSRIIVDRKMRPSEIIDDPALTLSLMIQPQLLDEIMSNQAFAGRGLLARFLYAIPKTRVGTRMYHTSPVQQKVTLAYDDLLVRLLSIKETDEPRIIKLSPSADKEAEAFFDSMEQRLVDDLESIEAWSAKLHGAIMRIAAILHVCIYLEAAEEKDIQLSTMRTAESIGMFFMEHAKVAFGLMGMSETAVQKDARYILKRLGGSTEITKRNLHQRCRGRFKAAEDMQLGLGELVRRGYVCIEYRQTVGRPTEIIKVNPLSQNTQNTQNIG